MKEGGGMNINKSRSLISKIIWGIIIAAIAFFFVRIAVWEYNYYREKEGSPRAVIEETEEEEVLNEEDVTVEEREEYKVAPDKPRYLSIEKLGIKNARILEMTLKMSGELQTPQSIFDVGWYSGSGKPGEGRAIVIDGHNGGPTKVGVFKYLPELKTGDIITIERGDGKIFNYEVIENLEVPLENAGKYMSSALVLNESEDEALTLITCTGEWSQSQKTYLSRQFTRAVLKID